MSNVISIEQISKLYRLGEIGTGVRLTLEIFALAVNE
jgi:hypothetical protein